MWSFTHQPGVHTGCRSTMGNGTQGILWMGPSLSRSVADHTLGCDTVVCDEYKDGTMRSWMSQVGVLVVTMVVTHHPVSLLHDQ
jgi:hypothetical protein